MYLFKTIIKVAFIFCITMVAYKSSNAQYFTLKGSIKDSISGTPIVNAFVVVKKTITVIAYGKTDLLGEYEITIKLDSSHSDDILVEVNSIGYVPSKIAFSNQKNVYNFLLKESVTVLEDVTVKAVQPISQKSDTIKYQVNAFAEKQDVSIGDVLKRLPGISVDEKGQIYFNGKSISNLFIQGDDLMDGRYGLATKTIRWDMIERVDVLQNHQRIQVLRDKVFNDEVAVNLILKGNKLKAVGQGMIGIGHENLREASSNMLLFNPQIKSLNNLQANNTGVDYRNEFERYQEGAILEQKDIRIIKPLLHVSTNSAPDLAKNNYYFNNSFVTNLNNLINNKDSLQFKTSIQFFSDKNRLESSRNSIFYLPEDTIAYNENYKPFQNIQLINALVSFEKNKKSAFFSNQTRLSVEEISDNGNWSFNNRIFDQQLKTNKLNLSNEFNWIIATKKLSTIRFSWLMQYYRQPQIYVSTLVLSPDILNNGNPYQSIQQTASIPSFINYLTVGFNGKLKKNFQQEYDVGILVEKNGLNSLLEIIQPNGSAISYKGDVGNNLSWAKTKFFFNSKYNIVNDKWRISLLLPGALQVIGYKQSDYNLNVQKVLPTFNPTTSFTLNTNPEDRFSVSYQNSTVFGDITGLYRGLVQTSLFMLNSNRNDLVITKSNQVNVNYQLQRSVSMFFSKIGLSYQEVTENKIQNSSIADSFQNNINLPLSNERHMLSFFLISSKYFFKLKTKISVNANISTSRFDVLLNNQRVSIKANSILSGIGIDKRISDNFNLSYFIYANWSTIVQGNTSGIQKNLISQYDQQLNIGFSIGNKLMVQSKNRFILRRQSGFTNTQNLFSDLLTKYKIGKRRTELELEIRNASNVKNYQTISLLTNTLNEENYMLRGRMFIIRGSFYF